MGLGYLYNSSPVHNINLSIETLRLNFSFGFWRGLVGFSVGILLGALLNQINKIKICPLFIYVFGIGTIGLSVNIFKLYPPTPFFDFLWYIIGCVIIVFCYLIPNPPIKSLPGFFLKLPLSIYLSHPILVAFIKTQELNISWSIYLVLVFLLGFFGVAYMQIFYNRITWLFLKYIKQ